MNKYAKRLIKYGIKNYKRYMIIVLILGIITIIFGSLRPFFLQYLIDEIISLQKINILPYFLIFLTGVVALERSFNYFFNTYHRKVNFLTIK
ncbi:MAG TPA: ABC transporter ATP-binding protein, partial [Defluviitoga sp.]|nr:ABC transporter ATP-binding protein [Defluviitoga sp.]